MIIAPVASKPNRMFYIQKNPKKQKQKTKKKNKKKTTTKPKPSRLFGLCKSICEP